MPVDPAEAVVLHTSWLGRLATVATPMVLTPLAGVALARNGIAVVPLLLLAATLLTWGVALFDFPLRSRFDADGITRRCLLRAQVLAWEDIKSIQRAPKGRLSRRPGGLSAHVGKRPYMLCDRSESGFEFDAINNGIYEWDPVVLLRAKRPDSTTPTWIHKRPAAQIGPSMVDQG